MTKSFNQFFLWTIALATALMLSISLPANAAPATTRTSLANYVYQGTGVATAGTTFATTSYADLTGASVSVVPFHNDPTTAARNVADKLKISWALDVVKATSTTLTCAIYANGAVIAASARTVDTAAKNTVMSGVYVVDNSVVGTQTVKLQCKSGDTATGTVNFGQITVEEIVY